LVSRKPLKQFDIRQPVFFADFSWDVIMRAIETKSFRFYELPKQLPVQRDLSITVPKSLPYTAVEKAVLEIKLQKLKKMQLFDIFESDKLGIDKKSFAVSFTFLDEEKTLNDTEIDGMMKRIMSSLESELKAEIRR
jgi:phenylalanyl-tRNA synthetase beta chain